MSRAEVDYFETFAMHHGDEFRAYNLDGSWVGNRMSSFSYSHQLDTGDLGVGAGIGRLRVGTTIKFEEMWEAARPVLTERGILLPPELGPEFDVSNSLSGGVNKDFSFHGLGWDAGAVTSADGGGETTAAGEAGGGGKILKFKVFLMYHGLEALAKNPAWLSLVEEGVESMCLEHGLVSFVYAAESKEIREQLVLAKVEEEANTEVRSVAEDSSGDAALQAQVHAAQVLETRVVVYPKSIDEVRKAGLDAPAYTGTTALMFSSTRGMVPLFDLERNRLCAWRSQIPKNGQDVIDRWSAVGLSLETVSYVTATNYNLYFPSA